MDLLEELNRGSDAMVPGRMTYEAFIAFWPSQTHNEFGFSGKLNGMPKFVISTTSEKADWNNSTIIRQNTMVEIARLKRESGGNIGITGSPTLVHSLTQAELIDDLYFMVFPIILGKGFRLFQDYQMISMKLIEAKPYSSGVALLYYQPEEMAF